MLVQSHDGALHLLPALPKTWTEGEVSGLRARGGFVADISWSGSQLQHATIHATIGGKLRLRSSAPLKGKGLKPAKGACPNQFMQSANVRQPLRSPELTSFEPAPVPKVYEYDVTMKPGTTIQVSAVQ